MQSEIKEAVRDYYELFFNIGAVYEKLAKRQGLTSSALFVLHMLYEYQDQCTQRLICEKLLYPKQTVNTILNSFAKQGYIQKETVALDKRNKYIRLTEAGRKYAGSVLAPMFHMEETALAKMDAAARKAMLDGQRIFLNQLTHSLHSLEQGGLQG